MVKKKPSASSNVTLCFAQSRFFSELTLLNSANPFFKILYGDSDLDILPQKKKKYLFSRYLNGLVFKKLHSKDGCPTFSCTFIALSFLIPIPDITRCPGRPWRL